MADVTALKGGDILGGIGVGGGGGGIGTIGTVFLWFLGILLVFGIIAGIVIYFINKKSYKMQIWIFGKVAGVPMYKYTDKGKFMAFGMAGDKLIRLQKLKKFLPPPRIQMGKDIYWYYEREDGELINFSLEDLDEVQKLAGAYYVDTDMRMQRLGIEKNLRERMEKKGWLEKYGSTVAGVIFVIMVTVALVVLFSKLKDVALSMDSMAQSVNGMANAIEKWYTARTGGESPSDVIGNGGTSGLVPALGLFLITGIKNFRRKKWFQKQ